MKVRNLIFSLIAVLGLLLMMGGCMGKKEQLITFEEYYNQKIEAFAQENQDYAAGEVDVVFLGDSLTDFMDNQKFYPQYVTLNRGIAGDTTNGLETRLQVSLFDVQPKAVVMLIGINNLDTMFDNYETLLQKMQNGAPNTKIFLLSLSPIGGAWPASNEKIKSSNVQIEQLAEKYGDTFVDIHTPLYDAENDEIKNEYTVDGGHFTEQGYRVIVNTVTPYLVNALEK